MNDFLKVTLWAAVTAALFYAGIKLEASTQRSESRTWLMQHRDQMAQELLNIFRGYEPTAQERKWVIVGVNHKHESSGAFWDPSHPDTCPSSVEAAGQFGINCIVAYGGRVTNGKVVEWFDITPLT